MARHEERDDSYDLLNQYLQEIARIPRLTPERERELGRQITTAQPEALASMTRAAVMDHDWPVALSILRLEIDAARRVKKPFVLIQEILYRAEVYRRN